MGKASKTAKNFTHAHPKSTKYVPFWAKFDALLTLDYRLLQLIDAPGHRDCLLNQLEPKRSFRFPFPQIVRRNSLDIRMRVAILQIYWFGNFVEIPILPPIVANCLIIRDSNPRGLMRKRNGEFTVSSNRTARSQCLQMQR